VPIQYAQKEKMLTRVISDTAINRPDAIILPAISFEIKDVVYDTDRKLNSIGRNLSQLSNTNVQVNLNPVPYNIHMDMWVYVKNNEDATKIVEQIVPFFTPDFTLITTMFPNVPAMAIPIILDGVRIDEQNDTNFKDRTVIIWNLGFTVKSYFYGPVKSQPVINLANVDFSTWDGTFTPNIFENFGLKDITDTYDSNNSTNISTINNTEVNYLTTNGSVNTTSGINITTNSTFSNFN
jgi:hypothetical protein